MFEHWMVFTCLYFLAVLLVFFFMAGQWPYYLAYKQARLCWPPAGVPSNTTRAATGVDWCEDHALHLLACQLYGSP
jgi:hypothetical protein